MSQRTINSCLIGAVLALVFIMVYNTIFGAAQAAQNIGLFRSGSAIGEERAGFSGRAQVIVYGSPPSCLDSEAVAAEMDFFTGVIGEGGEGVLVRGLQGQVLGTLPASYTCADLVELLQWVRAASTAVPEPSPIYARLLESPIEAVDGLDVETANRYVDLLEEFEGAAHPSVQAAKARLGR